MILIPLLHPHRIPDPPRVSFKQRTSMEFVVTVVVVCGVTRGLLQHPPANERTLDIIADAATRRRPLLMLLLGLPSAGMLL